MRWASIPWSPSDRVLRQFGLLGLLIFGSWGGWQVFGLQRTTTGAILLSLALVMGLVGWIQPRRLRPLFVTWIVVAFPIGWTLSNLIMALLYYLIMLPIGLVMRVIGRDTLRIRHSSAEATGTTYWETRPASPDPGRYFKPY